MGKVWRPLCYLFGFTCILVGLGLISYFIVLYFNFLEGENDINNNVKRDEYNFGQIHPAQSEIISESIVFTKRKTTVTQVLTNQVI